MIKKYCGGRKYHSGHAICYAFIEGVCTEQGTACKHVRDRPFTNSDRFYGFYEEIGG